MTNEFPETNVAGEAAPSYVGEKPFSLWHFSEDPSLSIFEPHVPKTNSTAPPLVWAIDTRHSPTYWFPRDCPRACIWPLSTTTDADQKQFFGQTRASRIHVVESDWLEAIRTCKLFAYQLPAASFRIDVVVGYWVSELPVESVDRLSLGELLAMHAAAGIEVRAMTSLTPFWSEVVRSTLGFSGCRLQNANGGLGV